MPREFSLFNHTNRHALSVQNLRSQNCLNGVPNGMTEVEKVSQTTFALIS